MRASPSLILLAASLAATSAFAADAARNRWGYTYPAALDAEISAAEVHRVHYEDDHIMVMEVSNPPGYQMRMHGHPYPSVFARNAGGDATTALPPQERYLDPSSKMNGQNWRNGPAPQGLAFPTCQAADPQAPHLPVNDNPWPLHFYRIEFKRLDGEEGGTARYRNPTGEQVRYESDVVRVVEATVQPGQTLSSTAGSLPTVYALDTPQAFEAVSNAVGAGAGKSPPPLGMTIPRCITHGASGTPVVNTTGSPLHYYRIDFKRIDGREIATRWREWYPFMLEMK